MYSKTIQRSNCSLASSKMVHAVYHAVLYWHGILGLKLFVIPEIHQKT